MRRVLRATVCLVMLGTAAAYAEEGGHGAGAGEPEAGHVAEQAQAAPSSLAATGPLASEAPEGDAEAGADAEQAKWPKSRSPMPFDVMRSVEFLQDQVARGNDRAIRVQALLLRRFGRSFLEADPAVWQDSRNFRAVVLFTLSGGSPDVLERLMREEVLDPKQKPLLEGALAYVRNDFDKARTSLKEVDLASLEPLLAAQISLVMGQIDQVDHPADAVPHLDRARLLAPGTLIEEAALRLEAMLVDGLGDHAEADRLARRYFDRYSESSYAANFEARFAAIYAGRAMADPVAAMTTMADVVAALPAKRQQVLFLAVARRSLVEGNLVFAHEAAGRALAMPEMSREDRQRGELYETASALGTADASQSRDRLDALDRSVLHPEDVTLLDAAYSILGSIDGSPVLSAAADDPQSPASPELPPVLARAEQALANASQDLKQSQP